MSKKIIKFDANNELLPATGNEPKTYTTMSNETQKALSDYRNFILSSAVNLVRMIDSYTYFKSQATGNPINTISDFRADAVAIATAAASEIVNPDDDSFDEDDARNAEHIMDMLELTPPRQARR